jgi:hypothetical protein
LRSEIRSRLEKISLFLGAISRFVRLYIIAADLLALPNRIVHTYPRNLGRLDMSRGATRTTLLLMTSAIGAGSPEVLGPTSIGVPPKPGVAVAVITGVAMGVGLGAGVLVGSIHGKADAKPVPSS